jgi:hypothetical protein
MEDILPTEFQLSQNYPNPFTEQTIIKYCLPDKVKVKLELFDSEKKKIKILVDEIKEAGTYQVVLNSKGLRDGNYYYRMEIGNFVEIKKMILKK